jgi:hypothetical protein
MRSRRRGRVQRWRWLRTLVSRGNRSLAKLRGRIYSLRVAMNRTPRRFRGYYLGLIRQAQRRRRYYRGWVNRLNSQSRRERAAYYRRLRYARIRAARLRAARLRRLRLARLRLLRAKAARRNRILNRIKWMQVRYRRSVSWFARWNRRTRRTYRQRMYYNRVAINHGRAFLRRLGARMRAVRVALRRTGRANKRLYFNYLARLRRQRTYWIRRTNTYVSRLRRYTKLERLRVYRLRQAAIRRARLLRIRRERNKVRGWLNSGYRTLVRYRRSMSLWRRRNRRRGIAYLRWARNYMNRARWGYRRIQARIRWARNLRKRTSRGMKGMYNVYLTRLNRRLVYYRNWMVQIRRNVRRIRAWKRKQDLFRIARLRARARLNSDNRKMRVGFIYVQRVERFEKAELRRLSRMGALVKRINKVFKKYRTKYRVTSRLYMNAEGVERRLLSGVINRLRTKYFYMRNKRKNYIRRQNRYAQKANKISFNLLSSLRKQLSYYRKRILSLRSVLRRFRGGNWKRYNRILSAYIRKFSILRTKYRYWGRKAARAQRSKRLWYIRHARMNKRLYMKAQIKVALYKRLYRAASASYRNVYAMVLRLNQRRLVMLRRLTGRYLRMSKVCGRRLQGYLRITYEFKLSNLKLVRVTRKIIRRRRVVRRGNKICVYRSLNGRTRVSCRYLGRRPLYRYRTIRKRFCRRYRRRTRCWWRNVRARVRINRPKRKNLRWRFVRRRVCSRRGRRFYCRWIRTRVAINRGRKIMRRRVCRNYVRRGRRYRRCWWVGKKARRYRKKKCGWVKQGHATKYVCRSPRRLRGNYRWKKKCRWVKQGHATKYVCRRVRVPFRKRRYVTKVKWVKKRICQAYMWKRRRVVKCYWRKRRVTVRVPFYGIRKPVKRVRWVKKRICQAYMWKGRRVVKCYWRKRKA